MILFCALFLKTEMCIGSTDMNLLFSWEPATIGFLKILTVKPRLVKLLLAPKANEAKCPSKHGQHHWPLASKFYCCLLFLFCFLVWKLPVSPRCCFFCSWESTQPTTSPFGCICWALASVPLHLASPQRYGIAQGRKHEFAMSSLLCVLTTLTQAWTPH